MHEIILKSHAFRSMLHSVYDAKLAILFCTWSLRRLVSILFCILVEMHILLALFTLCL